MLIGLDLDRFSRRAPGSGDSAVGIEPAARDEAIGRGTPLLVIEWETGVRAAYHRLARTPMFASDEGAYYSRAWSEAHRRFHRALLEGCDNPFLLDTFDRMWTASELYRRLSVHRTRTPERDITTGHQRLEQTAIARDVETCARLLAEHLSATAAALTTDSPPVRAGGPSGS